MRETVGFAPKIEGGFHKEKNMRLGQRIKRTGKALKRSVAAIAVSSLAFRQLRGMEATMPQGPLAFQNKTPDEKVMKNVIPVATKVVATAGAGAAVVTYIIKRGKKEESDDAESTELEEIPSMETEESTSVVDSAEEETRKKDQEIIAVVLAKVKDAKKKALEATAVPSTPDIQKEPTVDAPDPGYTAEEELEVVNNVFALPSTPDIQKEPTVDAPDPGYTAEEELKVVNNVSALPSTPDIQKEQAVDAPDPGYTAEEKLEVVNNVFECHGFFPDLRSEDDLPPEVRMMRQQPKSQIELASIKKKYEAISNEAERVYTMLVDLGMMESYEYLEEYSDDFDEFDL